MEAVIYNKQTGEIYFTARVGSAADAALYADTTRGAITVPDNTVERADQMWVDKGVVKAATNPAVTLSSTVAAPGENVTIDGLPNPCWILNTNTGTLHNITSGSYTFTCTEEKGVSIVLQGKYYGDYRVQFSNLAKAKETAKLKVDAAAEAARLRVVTPGSGQAMTYLRKADAATAFLAGDTLSDQQLQRLEDEAARLGITVQQAAETLAATAAAWEGLDATIDNIRLVAKLNIDNATTGAAVDAVLSTLSWPV